MKTIVKPVVLVAAALGLLTQSGVTQSGSVDTTFMHRVGPDGPVNAVVLQPDGMVVFGGAFANVNHTPFNGLCRADTNGDVDASFIIGSGADAVVNALALQGDGKILVAGTFANFNGIASPSLIRLNRDGSPDASFVTGAGADGPVNFVAWQTNGQVLIQGVFSNYNSTPRLGLARLNTNGTLDTSFTPGDRAASLTALAWQADGKVVFSGNFTNLDGIGASYLARLNADGSLDTNFCATANLDSYATALALQPDERMLVGGGFSQANGLARSGVARFNTNATLDTSFDPGTGFGFGFGRRIIKQVHLALRPDGETLAWGTFESFNGTNLDGVARLTATGGLDSTLNTLADAPSFNANSIAFLADGRFITGGSSSSFSYGYLIRHNPDGTSDGWMNETAPDGQVLTILPQPDGKILVGGWEFESIDGLARTNLARLNADGSLDQSFVANLWDPIWTEADLFALQPDGKVLVCGHFAQINGAAVTNLARLNPDGSVDGTFQTVVGGASRGMYALAVQPDGRILLGGAFTNVNGMAVSGLARLNSDGSLDTTFNPGTGNNALVTALTLQPDGHLLVGASITTSTGATLSGIVRLNLDGSMDNTFGFGVTDGSIQTIALQNLGTDHGVLPLGYIIVGGLFTHFNGVAASHLARLTYTGSIDSRFAGSTTYAVATLLIQPDGKILARGGLPNGSYGFTDLGRFNADGSMDTTFTPWPGMVSISAMAMQADGRILVGEETLTGSGGGEYSMLRLFNDVGTPLQDPVSIPIQPPSYVTAWTGSNALFGVSSGSALFGASVSGTPPLSFQWQCNGTNLPGQTSGFCQLANLSLANTGIYTLIVSNASGAVTSAPVHLAVVSATGLAGSVHFHLPAGSGPDAGVWTIAEQTDGKLLIGGNFTHFNGIPHGGLVRLNPDGSFDTNFLASAGVDNWGQVYTLLPQPDGKILVGGWFQHCNGTLCTNLARLNANGSLDTNFSASVDGWSWPIALQSDGKFLVGGSFAYADGVARNNIARFKPDGSLDPSFDPGAGADNYTGAILVQPDGKILVGGMFGWFANVFGGIARLNTNGTVDATFSNCTGIGAEDWFGMINEFALQPDGKMLVAGWFDDFDGAARTNLVRLNSDGSLDTTFVPAPLAWQTIAGELYGLALQPDGKVVIGLWPTNTPGGGPCVARPNSDGSLDPTFQIGSCSADGIWYLKLLADGEIIVGGGFPDFKNAATPYLAWLFGDEPLAIAPFSLGQRWNGGQLELGLFGEAGRIYDIDASTNLPQFNAWTNFLFTGTNWLAVPNQLQQFFRARTGN